MEADFCPQIVTANDLMNGDTVYLDTANDWVRDHRNARVAGGSECAQTMLRTALEAASGVVGPRLIDVDLDSRSVAYPRDFRERARIVGPTVGQTGADRASGADHVSIR